MEQDGLKIAVLIPARYGSTRFPGKALASLNGTPLAKVVFDRCKETSLDTFLLSDDERICSIVQSSIMTSSSCENGTERCAEAAACLPQYGAFINVQGDLPDVTPGIILKIAERLHTEQLVTAFTAMDEHARSDQNTVKLIHNGSSAHWFCRASLKYGDQHLGIYGYHRELLLRYPQLKPSFAESVESLEQLRWLAAGYTISVVEVDFDGVEINCPEDLKNWREKQRPDAADHKSLIE